MFIALTTYVHSPISLASFPPSSHVIPCKRYTYYLCHSRLLRRATSISNIRTICSGVASNALYNMYVRMYLELLVLMCGTFATQPHALKGLYDDWPSSKLLFVVELLSLVACHCYHMSLLARLITSHPRTIISQLLERAQ